MTELYIANTDCLQDKELFDACYTMLPSFRKEKVDRLENVEKKALSMGAFLLLTAALKKRDIPPEKIAFTYNDCGKPMLSLFPETHFSLSHSANRVLCAVSDSAVGCDAEHIRPTSLSLADRFFTPIEQEQIAKASDRKKMFFRLWTLKESVIKATGQSLSHLKDFSVIINENGIILDPYKNFYLQEFFLEDDYCYACCSKTLEALTPVTINLEDIKRP